MTRAGGPYEQDGGPFEKAGGPFEQDGGPFEQAGGTFEQDGGSFGQAEASSRGVFEGWRNRGGDDGTRGESMEGQKTTAAPPSPAFPHAIPDDVQFFEPSMVSIILSSL